MDALLPRPEPSSGPRRQAELLHQANTCPVSWRQLISLLPTNRDLGGYGRHGPLAAIPGIREGKTYWVYITTSKPHGVLYAGLTGDLAGRTWEHRERVMEGFTKKKASRRRGRDAVMS